MAKSLRQKYQEDISPSLMKELGFTNIHQVPSLVKVVINVGLGEAVQNSKVLDTGLADLATISGQKPIMTKAKKSIATYKLRAGMPIGGKVTLRGNRMYDFVAKLNGVAIPRIRDFRGLNDKGFDGRGNYNLGLKDQLVFPEISYDKVDKVRGMNITIVTTATNDMEAKALLSALGFPFKRTKEKETA